MSSPGHPAGPTPDPEPDDGARRARRPAEVPGGRPVAPLAGRQRALVAYLDVAVVVAAVAAVVELAVPVEHRATAGRVMVAVLVLAPVGRVVWLLVRWLRRGDRRFAAVAGLLLVVLGLAYALR